MRWLLLLCCCHICQVLALDVVFLNYGKQEEAYWQSASRAMQAAADDLGVQLQVIYGERNQHRLLAAARELAARPKAQQPDYVIFSNDFALGETLLPILDEAGIKTFMAFSGNVPGDNALGKPRERYRHWLGSLEPDAEQAGYLTARSLIEQARRHGKPHSGRRYQLLALHGDPLTPSSIRRSEGMRRAAKEAKDVLLASEVYAAWERKRAEDQASWMFRRYQQADMVWAANDLMAFGAMDAWTSCCQACRLAPRFSGINTSDQALTALSEGKLAALAGGHFMTGAVALVMLHDHAKGRDFADLGLEQTLPVFMLFDHRSAQRFMQRFKGDDFSSIDFSAYSRVLNPQRKQYSFSFRPLLQ